MVYIVIFALLLVALVATLLLVRDSHECLEDESMAISRAVRSSRCASFIVKFGCVLTAFGLFGASLASGASLAMAFPIPKPSNVQPSSWFDHRHNVATTIPFGAVVPVDWRYMLPGEKYKQNLTGFCRALSLKAPVMHDIDLKYATYFVPLRLLNDHYEEIIADAGLDRDAQTFGTTPPAKLRATNNQPYSPTESKEAFNPFVPASNGKSFPYFVFNAGLRNSLVKKVREADNLASVGSVARSFLVGGLMDYLGFPVGSYSYLHGSTGEMCNHPVQQPIGYGPLMAYHSICNHFFVDDFHRRDYVDELVKIPVDSTGLHRTDEEDFIPLFRLRYSSWESDYFVKSTTTTRSSRVLAASSTAKEQGAINDPATSFFLNADTIRGMFQLDEYARKVEVFFGDVRRQIKLMFGVRVSDKSALSPILVDGGSAPVQVSELTNMSGGNSVTSPDSLPLGANAGKMTAGFGKAYSTFEVEEHGIIMTCVWVRPQTCYLNKFPHMFGSFLDHASIPNPLFAQIGERSIPSIEVNYDPFRMKDNNEHVSDSIFGYNAPYVQYKYSLDSMTGDFRDNLVYWHCARDFSNQRQSPSTSYQFSLINPDYFKNEQSMNRIFNVIEAVDGSRPFQLQLRFNVEIWQPYPHIDNEF